VSVLFWLNGKSQQIPTYSQYTENLFLINPAVAGSEERTIFSLNNRLQWLGMRDAPQTSTFSGQGNLGHNKILKFLKLKNGSGKKTSVGIGGSVYNDKNVLLSQTGAQFAYAYHIPFRGSTKLSMGLALSSFQSRIDKNSAYTKEYEPLLATARPAYIIDASVGFLLSNRSYFVGISALQVSQSLLNLGDNMWDKYQKFRHYYIVGGYNYEINSEYTVCPSVLIRTTDKFSTLQTDFTCKVIYMERFWGGISYRSNKEMIFFVGISQNKMYFTYSYDYPTKAFRQPSYGSHELTVSLKLGRPQKHRGIAR
jgi:type IX secretion system PorP/SprF family membrane protein